LTIPICSGLSYPNYVVLQGEEVTFSWGKEEALIKDASVEYEGLFLSGSSLSLARDKITMEDTYLTTCDLPHPHYKVGAKYLVLPLDAEKGKLYAEGVALYIGKRKIFSLPPFRIALNPQERARESVLPMPRVEFSEDMGFSLVEEFSFSFREDNGRFKIGYSTEKGFLGRVSLPLLPYTTLNLSRYEEITGKTTSPLYISEEPHILWQYGGYSISLGKFREDPTDRQSKRFRASFSLPLFREDVGANLSIGLLGKGAYSIYDKGKEYRSIGGEISLLRERKSSQANIAFGYLASGGSTPFLFDKEELTSYARMDLANEGNKWRWELNGIWDLKENELYDAGFALYRKLHCLEPGISWQKRGGILQLRLKVVGF